MSDEQMTEVPEKVEGPKDAATQINEHVLRPIDELVKSMQMHDATIKETLGGLKRLFKQSKGRGDASLTEHIQLYAALYGLLHLGQTQNVIIGQQLSTDMDRTRWHLFALQDFLFEQLFELRTINVPWSDEAKAEMTKTWRSRIDELFRSQRQTAIDARVAMFDKHKADILDAAVKDLKRPPLQKTEQEADKKIIPIYRA